LAIGKIIKTVGFISRCLPTKKGLDVTFPNEIVLKGIIPCGSQKSLVKRVSTFDRQLSYYRGVTEHTVIMGLGAVPFFLSKYGVNDSLPETF
jgi:hypothetical protein